MRKTTNLNIKFCFLFFISVLFLSDDLVAQIIIDEPPKRLYYSRTVRIKKFKDWYDMRDALHYDKYLLGRRRIMGNVSYNTGRVQVDDGHVIHQETRQAIGYFTRIRFLEEFYVNTTFYKDYNPRAAAPWIADYSYSIGRYNWEDNKLNFGYENYGQNKYSDDMKGISERFTEGYYYISLNKFLSDSATRKIMLDSNSTSMRFIFFARYAIKYRDRYYNVKGGLFSGKPTVGVALRYTIGWNIYIESAVYYYFNPSVYQQPWDPDFTYGFGYFNWRAFRICLTYGNWAINRFSWNKTYYPLYGFQDGQFRIAVNWAW